MSLRGGAAVHPTVIIRTSLFYVLSSRLSLVHMEGGHQEACMHRGAHDVIISHRRFVELIIVLFTTKRTRQQGSRISSLPPSTP